MQSPFVSEAKEGLLCWVHSWTRWPHKCLQFSRVYYPQLSIYFSEGSEKTKFGHPSGYSMWAGWRDRDKEYWHDIVWKKCSNQCLFGGGEILIWASKYEIFSSLQMNAGCVCIATTKRAVLCGKEKKEKSSSVQFWELMAPLSPGGCLCVANYNK